MDDSTEKRYYWVLLGMAIIIAFAFQGSRGLYETTEGRYAEVAREMLENGNYLEPTLAYRPHWTKPPLTYWAIAGGIKIFGQNAWGVRFYNSLAFILTVFLISRMGTLLWNRHTGIAAGLIYSTSVFPVFAMSTVSTDTLLTLWTAAAVYSYLKASRTPDTRDARKWVLFMWVFFGAGFFTKGPPALLPLFAISVWHFTFRKPWRLFTPQGLGAFLAVSLWWYVLVCFRHPGLLGYFLGQELVARVATDTFNRNAAWYKPFILYLPALTLGAGFWFFYLVKTVFKERLFCLETLWAHLRAGQTGAFLLLWISIPLAVFFVAKSRLPLYVLPLYGPVVLMIARGIGNHVSLKKITLIAVISAMALIGSKGLAAQYPRKNDMKYLLSWCRRVGGKDVQILSYLEIRLYGLQFYLDGNFKRLADETMAWSDARIFPFIRETLKKDRTHPYVILTRRRYGHYLKEKLIARKIKFQSYHDKFWELCLISPEAPP